MKIVESTLKEIKFMRVGNDVVCRKYCVFRAEGGFQPCGEKEKCLLYDSSDKNVQHYREEVLK